jgi:hypothetical protein
VAVPARDLPLRSPWDLAVAGDWLLVAMAGTHQVWAFDSVEETIGVLAGSGRETLEDGSFARAGFAQPSGLALAGSRVYVADSETSSVRYLDLAQGQVRTLVGKGLFDFGDRDGPASEALLQHPIGLGHGPAGLLVADSYNDKIKAVDEETGEVRTWFKGVEGLALREPGGLCQLADGRVIVADTNHHRLLEIEAGGRGAAVLEVKEAAGGTEEPGARSLRVITLKTATVGSGAVTLRIVLEPPPGLELSEGSRVGIRLSAEGPLQVPGEDQGFEVTRGRRAAPVRIAASGPGEGAIEIALDATACSHGDAAACWPLSVRYRLPVRVTENGSAHVLPASLALPDPR